MNPEDFSLFAVFVTGLLGGVHCAGMCGGIVSALGVFQQKARSGLPRKAIPVEVAVRVEPNVPTALSAVALYNLGRISTYTALGALVGAIGSAAWLMQSVLPVQQTAYLLSQLLLILMGIYIAGYKRIGALMEAAAAPVWRVLKPRATRSLSTSGWAGSLLAGSLWGLVPCGMVYAVLSIALVSGGPGRGALLMLVFGLGTLPNLMLLGLSGQWLGRISRHRYARLFAGLLIMGLGFWGLVRWIGMGQPPL